MHNFPSAAARKRYHRVHQRDDRREDILRAARELFLEQGLSNTSMTQIAARAGITKVTLYRYFPDRHPIALEIAARMLRRIFAAAAEAAKSGARSRAPFHSLCVGMISEFHELRDAYRYMGLFDQLYTPRHPSPEFAEWYRTQIVEAVNVLPGIADPTEPAGVPTEDDCKRRKVVLMNTILSFLEKMAARGNLMGAEQNVPVEVQLELFRTFVVRVLNMEFPAQKRRGIASVWTRGRRRRGRDRLIRRRNRR